MLNFSAVIGGNRIVIKKLQNLSVFELSGPRNDKNLGVFYSAIINLIFETY